MNIFKLYKQSFSTIVTNPNITLFLVLFLILSNVFALYVFSAKTFIVAMILSFCVFLLSLCFVSGWFNVIKDVAKSENNKIQNSTELNDSTYSQTSTQSKNYFSIFLEGIGKNIIPVGIGSLIYTLILILVFTLSAKFANHFFGSLDFLLKDLTTIAQDNKALMEYFDKLSVDQKYSIYAWQLCFILSSMIFNFIMLFYFPALIFNEKSNVFLRAIGGLKDSICFLFKNFFGALFLYVCIYSTYLFLGILKAIFVNNSIISIVIL